MCRFLFLHPRPLFLPFKFPTPSPSSLPSPFPFFPLLELPLMEYQDKYRYLPWNATLFMLRFAVSGTFVSFIKICFETNVNIGRSSNVLRNIRTFMAATDHVARNNRRHSFVISFGLMLHKSHSSSHYADVQRLYLWCVYVDTLILSLTIAKASDGAKQHTADNTYKINALSASRLVSVVAVCP